jgi:predicted XRE-type DNA-binding protein
VIAKASKLVSKQREHSIAKRVDNVSVTIGSGNVFADIGVPRPEEALAKAGLVHAIATVIARKKLTQKAVAELVGVAQPKISNLLNGNTLGFSSDRLIEFLLRLGYDVDINVRRPRGRLRLYPPMNRPLDLRSLTAKTCSATSRSRGDKGAKSRGSGE